MAAPKAAISRLLLVVLVIAVEVIVAVSAVGYAKRRQKELKELEDKSRKAAAILADIEDLLRRHPDFGFEEEGDELQKYRTLSERQQGSELLKIEILHRDLLRAAVSRATGRKPDEAGWEELLEFKTFSPNGFRALYESVQYPRTRALSEAPAITGDPGADSRIARLAAERGYRLRSEAEPSSLVGQLQEPAFEAIARMQKQAQAEGIRLEVVSGYRSVDRQRAIFLAALKQQGSRRIGRPYSEEQIASGEADAAVDAVLSESAPPGFSRHHTGYSVDLNDPSTGRPFTLFAESPAFRWLSGDNYRNAKRFGFIPSYPDGATVQGPEPEPWEYTWVSEQFLRSPETAGD